MIPQPIPLAPQQATTTSENMPTIGYRRILGIPVAKTIQFGQSQQSAPPPPSTPPTPVLASTGGNLSPQPSPDDQLYDTASVNAQKKYNVNVPSYLLKSVRQQESSGITNPNDYARTMGLTASAKAELGKDYLPDTSLANSIQNSANYLAKRATFVKPDKSTIDLSTPENMSKWYVQRYVGLFPGQSRMINNQKVSYDQLKTSFEKVLSSNQPKTRPLSDLHK